MIFVHSRKSLLGKTQTIHVREKNMLYSIPKTFSKSHVYYSISLMFFLIASKYTCLKKVCLMCLHKEVECIYLKIIIVKALYIENTFPVNDS